jgi:hypothetical protein
MENPMPHPAGGKGGTCTPVVKHTFPQAYAHVGVNGVQFTSTTGEKMIATRGFAKDGITPTIVLKGERNVHGRVCKACWGYMLSCTGERVGQAAMPLDSTIIS